MKIFHTRKKWIIHWIFSMLMILFFIYLMLDEYYIDWLFIIW
jgi:hypothetical protein